MSSVSNNNRRTYRRGAYRRIRRTGPGIVAEHGNNVAGVCAEPVNVPRPSSQHSRSYNRTSARHGRYDSSDTLLNFGVMSGCGTSTEREDSHKKQSCGTIRIPFAGVGSTKSTGNALEFRFNPNARPFIPSKQVNNVVNAKSCVDPSKDCLRERLKEQLEKCEYECMICFQTIYPKQWIWTCVKCFHMFHMNERQAGCIEKWAGKSYSSDSGWRCPSCQHETVDLPQVYRCFCGKKLNPISRSGFMPHSCQQLCRKSREFCPHSCTEICHPGPCPECPALRIVRCRCGAEEKAIRCGTANDFRCSKICSKSLNCGFHDCELVCHSGECPDCKHSVEQECFCGAETRNVQCTKLSARTKFYSCGVDSPCDGLYECQIHRCKEKKCHEKVEVTGSCGSCPLSTFNVTHCPCGHTPLSSLTTKARQSCTDNITTCNHVCDKVLTCGSLYAEPHRCKAQCHLGDCPPCRLTTKLECRCKARKKEVNCINLPPKFESFLCEQKCKKQMSCWNHRCQNICCDNEEHMCLQICDKMLNCGLHTCDRLCHRSKCSACSYLSYEDQYCLCGKTFREPPIPCGTPLPLCSHPCSRTHECGHEPTHNCHPDPDCPPCTILLKKPCYGKHEIRSNIPCYLNDVSCGRPCGRELPCGVHNCRRVCHSGPCLTEENPICRQLCQKRRIMESCEHPCGLSCHSTTPCAHSRCTALVYVTCQCLRKSEEMECDKVESLYRRALAICIEEGDGQKNSSKISILKRSTFPDKFRCIPCGEDCKIFSRNRRVADALEITTDSETKRVLEELPLYSDFLKLQCVKYKKYVLEIETALVALVNELNMNESLSVKTYQFRPMTSELRCTVHEYAAYFGISTFSHDPEPKRSVVAVAKKGLCKIPVILLSEVDHKMSQASSMKSGMSSANIADCEADISRGDDNALESGMQPLEFDIRNVTKRCKLPENDD